MKYFSPAILDGSVTTAKIADGAVTTVKLANASVKQAKILRLTGSQGGTIASSSSVLIAINSHAFLMDTEMEDGLNGRLVPAVKAVPAASPTQPQFNIRNQIAVAKLYDVAWSFLGA